MSLYINKFGKFLIGMSAISFVSGLIEGYQEQQAASAPRKYTAEDLGLSQGLFDRLTEAVFLEDKASFMSHLRSANCPWDTEMKITLWTMLGGK